MPGIVPAGCLGVSPLINQPIILDDEWPESIFHHVGSQSVSYLLSVQCEVFKSSGLR